MNTKLPAAIVALATKRVKARSGIQIKVAGEWLPDVFRNLRHARVAARYCCTYKQWSGAWRKVTTMPGVYPIWQIIPVFP